MPPRAYTLPETCGAHTGSQPSHTNMEAAFGGVKSFCMKPEVRRAAPGTGGQPLLPASLLAVCPSAGRGLEACPPAFMLSCVCLARVCLVSTSFTGCSSRAGTIQESLCHFLLTQSPPSSRLLVLCMTGVWIGLGQPCCVYWLLSWLLRKSLARACLHGGDTG